jgi:hypothetical protein
VHVAAATDPVYSCWVCAVGTVHCAC